jgi:hypothetical protein
MTATHNLPEIHVQFRVPSGQFVQQCLCEDGFPGPGVAHDQSIAFNAHQHIDNGGIPHGVNGGDDDFVKRHRGRGLLREGERHLREKHRKIAILVYVYIHFHEITTPFAFVFTKIYTTAKKRLCNIVKIAI